MIVFCKLQDFLDTSLRYRFKKDDWYMNRDQFSNRTVTYGVWVDGNDDQIRFITANIFITIINKGVTFDETLSLRLFDSVKSAYIISI